MLLLLLLLLLLLFRRRRRRRNSTGPLDPIVLAPLDEPLEVAQRQLPRRGALRGRTGRPEGNLFVVFVVAFALLPPRLCLEAREERRAGEHACRRRDAHAALHSAAPSGRDRQGHVHSGSRESSRGVLWRHDDEDIAHADAGDARRSTRR